MPGGADRPAIRRAAIAGRRPGPLPDRLPLVVVTLLRNSVGAGIGGAAVATPRRPAPDDQAVGRLELAAVEDGVAPRVGLARRVEVGQLVPGGADRPAIRRAAVAGRRPGPLPDCRLLLAVDRQRHATTAAVRDANVDSVRQLQLRAGIGCTHDQPVRARAEGAVVRRRLPTFIVRNPCPATMMAVQPVCAAAVQNLVLRGPSVPRGRANGKVARDDGPKVYHRGCGAGKRKHLVCGAVSRDVRLAKPEARQRRRVSIAAAVLPLAARKAERAGAVPRGQVLGVGFRPAEVRTPRVAKVLGR